MKRFALVTALVAAGAVIAVPVLADGGSKSGIGRAGIGTHQPGQMGRGGMMGGGMGRMMGMMQMMQDGQNGMMGQGGMGGFGAIDMAYDTDGDGTVSPEELRAGRQAALGTYDADGDGTLSLDEFEAFHADRIRERTVDRFQALDADGDGQVTTEEFAAPAERMERMIQRRAAAVPQQPAADVAAPADGN